MNRAARKRLFFALNPSDSVRQKVAALQCASGIEGRAVPPANFHATLAFLGMQQESVIPAVRAIASGLRFESCEVVLDRLGCFRRAGVAWLGASVVPQSLLDFQAGLVDALNAGGIGYDPKPWKLHLTLYRKMRKPPPTMDSEAVRWRLSGFSLVESVSVNRGVEYHDIAHWGSDE